MKPAFATETTGKAFVMVSIFNAEFGGRDVTGHRARLSEPKSPSSQSGLLAKQHITLERAGTPTIKVGWLNCADQQALLRSYDCINQIHHERYGESRVQVDKRAYADLFLDLASFLRKQSYTVKIQDADPKKSGDRRVKPNSTRPGELLPSRSAQLWWLVALMATIAIAATTILLLDL